MVAKVDGKGRVTIPLHMREILGIDAGSYLELFVDVEKRQLIIKPIIKGYAEGYLAEVHLKISEFTALSNAINQCVSEGYEIISLSCTRSESYECKLVVYVLELSYVDRLKEILSKYGFTDVKII